MITEIITLPSAASKNDIKEILDNAFEERKDFYEKDIPLDEQNVSISTDEILPDFEIKTKTKNFDIKKGNDFVQMLFHQSVVCVIIAVFFVLVYLTSSDNYCNLLKAVKNVISF